MELTKQEILNTITAYTMKDCMTHFEYERFAEALVKLQKEKNKKEAVMCVEEEVIIIEEPVHMMFGLSYASWLILPRVVLEAMPTNWQKKLVDLVRELDDAYEWHPGYDMFVQFRNRGKIMTIPEHFNNYRRPDIAWLSGVKREQD